MRPLCLALVVVAAASQDAGWRVTHPFYSAVTIGIGYKNDKVGWTSHTDGSSLPQIVRSDDGGATYTAVNSTTGVTAMTLGVAAVKDTDQSEFRTDVSTIGPLSSDDWSLDGENFKESLGGPFVSQDIKHQGGRMVATSSKGVCFSTSGGQTYNCKNAPLKYNGTARYSSSPSKGVIYLAAGSWPDNDPGRKRDGKDGKFRLTRNVRLVTTAPDFELRKWKVETKIEVGPEARGNDPPPTVYTAELWKSTDDGETWTNLMLDTGRFYFNDIDCIDYTHCVVVAEGFAHDGSTDPGARVFTTVDGKNFELAHEWNSGGTESLMTARMVSQTEHWLGGTAQAGSLTAPTYLFHTLDGGKSYTNENGGLTGQMITSMDMLSAKHGYATSINGASLCNLLEYGGATPSPPAPSPPTPGKPHYEKPPCGPDEIEASLEGGSGKLCAPPCLSSGACPTDKPFGVTASPQCALQDSSTGHMYCALLCVADWMCDKAHGAICNGVCMYNSTSAANHILINTVPKSLVI